MHIPDGFLAAPVWGGLCVVAAPAVVLAARASRKSLDESQVPMMGVLGAFVFAAQMVNFPLGAGTSGHLLGGALLAATLGPAPAIIVMTADCLPSELTSSTWLWPELWRVTGRGVPLRQRAFANTGCSPAGSAPCSSAPAWLWPSYRSRESVSALPR